jgi:hypothetical protein
MYLIFPHYLINGTIYGKNYSTLNVGFDFLYNFVIFLILKQIQRDIINVHTSSCKLPVIPVGFQSNPNSLDRFSKNIQILNVVKIRPVGAESFHADGHVMTKLIVTFRNFTNPSKI